jgi:hypothetical protein
MRISYLMSFVIKISPHQALAGLDGARLWGGGVGLFLLTHYYPVALAKSISQKQIFHVQKADIVLREWMRRGSPWSHHADFLRHAELRLDSKRVK